MTQPCVFCRIVAGEVPATILARTDRTVAFRDAAPVAPSHLLVVPVDHVGDVGELAGTDPGYLGEVVAAAARLAGAQGLSEGYRLVINTGTHGGQTVGHLHVHVLGGRQLGPLG